MTFWIGYYWYLRTLSIFIGWSYNQQPCWILFINSDCRFPWIFYESNDNMQIMTVLIFPFKFFYLYFFLTSLDCLGPPKQCWLEVVMVDIIILFLTIPLYHFSYIFTMFDIYCFHYCSVLVFHNFYFDFIPMSYFWVHLKIFKHMIDCSLFTFYCWFLIICIVLEECD